MDPTTPAAPSLSLAPSKPVNKRLVLTSVNQLLVLIKTNPQLAEAVPRLAQLAGNNLSETPKKSCNCGSKNNVTTTDVNKQISENVLSALTPQDFSKIKNVLGLNELCYYKREDKQLKMICV